MQDFVHSKGGHPAAAEVRLCKILSTQSVAARSCIAPINVKPEWASGELIVLSLDVALAKYVQDFVHQLSCDLRPKGFPK